MDILVACPANCATGGPECLHEFASNLNKIVNARIWYWNAEGDPVPDEYSKYNCEYVITMPDDFDGILIVPEIYASKLTWFTCRKAIYWLGVDAYATWTPPRDYGAFLDDDILHIVQSEYAYDFLSKLGVKRIVYCTDALNEDFYEPYKEEPRSDTVLYNPAKATSFMGELIKASGVEYKPIQNMTRAEVIDSMRHAKLYVDFGEFPGRERMPREAALCGCCLITSKIGSAAFYKDFAHDYKYDSKPGHIWAITHKIHYVLEHYDECKKDFDFFRQTLRKDRETRSEQCENVVRALYDIQHYNTGT